MKVQPIRQYRAAPGAMYNNGQAQEIGEFLERLPQWPALTTEQVVEAAVADDSPLHPLFTWDDRKAAELYRKRQARDIMNHLVIVDSGEEKKAFHNVSPPEPGEARQYLHVDRVRMEPEDAAEVIADAMAQLEGWLQRFNKYGRQLGPVFGAVEQAYLEYSEAERTA